jgi:hypothetical protein
MFIITVVPPTAIIIKRNWSGYGHKRNSRRRLDQLDRRGLSKRDRMADRHRLSKRNGLADRRRWSKRDQLADRRGLSKRGPTGLKDIGAILCGCELAY